MSGRNRFLITGLLLLSIGITGPIALADSVVWDAKEKLKSTTGWSDDHIIVEMYSNRDNEWWKVVVPSFTFANFIAYKKDIVVGEKIDGPYDSGEQLIKYDADGVERIMEFTLEEYANYLGKKREAYISTFRFKTSYTMEDLGVNNIQELLEKYFRECSSDTWCFLTEEYGKYNVDPRFIGCLIQNHLVVQYQDVLGILMVE